MMRWIAAICGLLLILILATGTQALTLKIATAAPEGSQWIKEMRSGIAEIDRRTEGRIRFKLYPGGVMGNAKSVIRKIRIGQLHGGMFTAGALNNIYPDINLYGLPLLFRSMDEVDYVRQRLDPLLMAGLEEKGFVSFGFSGGGFALMMADRPVRVLADIKGRKVWVPEGADTSYKVMGSLGLSPVTLPITDVMTGLQAGLIQVIGTSPIGAIVFQWHTRIKYANNTPLSYLYALMVIDKKVFKRMNPEDRQVTREVMGRIYAMIDEENRIDNLEAKNALAGQGIVFADTPPEEIEHWRQIAASLTREVVDQGKMSSDLYTQLLELLTTFRNGDAGSSK